MFRSIVVLVICMHLGQGLLQWDQNNDCPTPCTCQLQHLTETTIYRFLQKEKLKQSSTEVTSAEYNEVLNDDNFASEFLDEKPIVRSAICILQTETNPLNLIKNLSKAVESLTLIQGYATGHKSIRFSDLDEFPGLLSFELLGPNAINQRTNSSLIIEIDSAIGTLKYLNMENIKIKNSKSQLQKFVEEANKERVTFEFVKKTDANSHPLTFVQKSTDAEVLPYEKYKEQDDEYKIPLFVGFKQLHLLRITQCELNNVHWAMFDGLTNLQYLILERNNLKFIPPFAFYGTPNLRTLSLAGNNLLDIQITDLAGLLQLEYLDLSCNNFTQLSELSLPPFPKLKLANFANNPITVIFPNTFEVMNTTDSLIVGGDDVTLSLLTNSFIGLNLLKALTINNLHLKLLKRDLFVGMPNLNELAITGNITAIEYDTFLDVYRLKKLLLSQCKLRNLSMDAFIGLEHLEILDLSHNELELLPAVIFDQLINIKEIYLNGNRFKQLPRGIFTKTHVKLLRLTDNPWECSCEMSEWKPMLVNRVKRRAVKHCEYTNDKNVGCNSADRFVYKYVYDNKMAPKCAKPKPYQNWNVFHVMKRLLKCPEFKPKLKKIARNTTIARASEENSNVVSKFDLLQAKIAKHELNNDINRNPEIVESKTLRQNRLKTKLLKTKLSNTSNNVNNNII